MLLNLHVKNMMLIDNVDISFTDHLNILTGETGAGKSIIIGSILLALGERVNKDFIRKGAECGQVELLFSVERCSTKKQLAELGVDVGEEGELLISRTLYENRVINKLNDQTVTAAKLREVSEVLLDLHAQHEQQALKKKGYQMDILDRYGGEAIGSIRKQVSKAYKSYREAYHKLEAENISDTEQKRTMDLLKYEIEEIHGAKLKEGEDERLSEQYRRMKHGRELMGCLQNIREITCYDDSGSAGSMIGKAAAFMEQALQFDQGLSGMNSQLADIDALISDFNRELLDYIDGFQFDEQTFRETEERLDTLNTLKMKYGGSIREVLAYAEKNEEKYRQLANHGEYVAGLTADLEAKKQDYLTLCKQLHRERTIYGKTLKEEITKSLVELNFQNVDFDILIKETEDCTNTGKDDIIFMISTNVGERKRPLSEVASGGELSRIMLAVKAVLADRDETDTLIFDEIDVGISGRTAQRVSEKLCQIAKHHQVISITHLPQIAAMADAHYRIMKSVVGEKTVTDIVRLGSDETINELARLLGGVEITDTVLKNAGEMKAMALEVKKNI